MPEGNESNLGKNEALKPISNFEARQIESRDKIREYVDSANKTETTPNKTETTPNTNRQEIRERINSEIKAENTNLSAENREIKQALFDTRLQISAYKKRAEEAEARAEEAEANAAIDALTQINNRGNLNNKAEEIIKQKTPCAIAMIDIDFFKEVNDRYGHSVGDQVLKSFANALKTSDAIKTDPNKPSNIIARYGGEEFAILMPETGLLEAEQKVNQIREEIKNKHIETEKGNIKITFSAGIAKLTNEKEISELYDKADKGLYQAKKLGRNRVEIAGEENNEIDNYKK